MLRTILLPALLVGSLAIALPEKAEAAPLDGMKVDSALGGVRIHVGGGVSLPIGRRGHSHVHYEGGYWTTVRRRVWHPPEFIGYDSHGHPVYSQGHYDIVEERVWVPRRRVVHHRSGPRGRIHLGGRIRIR